MRLTIACALALFAACATAEPLAPGTSPLRPDAGAGIACNTHARALANFELMFGETPVVEGITEDGSLMQLLAAPSGTWSIFTTDAESGIACLRASGDGLLIHAEKPGRDA